MWGQEPGLVTSPAFKLARFLAIGTLGGSEFLLPQQSTAVARTPVRDLSQVIRFRSRGVRH